MTAHEPDVVGLPIKIVDEVFPFRAYGGRPGRCRVRIYRTDETTILAYSAISGPPLPYACEELIAALARRHVPGIRPDNASLRWLEHYPLRVRPYLLRHVAARMVSVEVGEPHPNNASVSILHPRWQDLSPDELQELIGESLD